MATIGSFTAGKDGYTGTIRTLTVNVKARIVANDQKKSDGAPDFRVYAGRAELGELDLGQAQVLAALADGLAEW